MKILVTGGAGYIGSLAVKKLIAAGHSVFVYDDLSSGNEWAIDEKATLIVGDIRDFDSISKAMKDNKIEAVLNFAAKIAVGESVEQPILYYDVNVNGVNTVLRAMKENGVKNLVHSSTAATYGTPEKMPVTEETPQLPESPYGDSKLASEKLILSAAKAYGINACIFRYFNVAGASDDCKIGLMPRTPITHIIPSIIMAAQGLKPMLTVFGKDYDTKDGTTIRDMIHVEDLIDAHLLGLDYIVKNNKTDIFNLGTGTGYTILEMIKAVEETTGLKVPYEFGAERPGDAVRIVASFDKAKKIIGWNPTRGLKEIIKTDSEFRKNYESK